MLSIDKTCNTNEANQDIIRVANICKICHKLKHIGKSIGCEMNIRTYGSTVRHISDMYPNEIATMISVEAFIR